MSLTAAVRLDLSEYMGGNIKMWAITSNGIGNEVSYRSVQAGWALLSGELFTVSEDPAGKVLAEDMVSLRLPSDADFLPEAKSKRKAYIEERSKQAALDANLTDGSYTYSTSTERVESLFRALTAHTVAAALSQPGPDIDLEDTTGVDRDLDFTALTTLMVSYNTNQQAARAVAKPLKAAVDSATTVAAVEAIDWPS